MNFKRKPINKLSDRGRIIKDCDRLHFAILKIKRGEFDEIDGRPANGLGRFHILSVATHPRLRYLDENVLLVNWLPHHFGWHHHGPADPRNKKILDRIAELRGENWEEALMERERFIGKMDALYLRCLKLSMQKELEALG